MNDTYTKEEALKDLYEARALSATGDKEAGHGDADEVLAKFLTALGYVSIVRAWEEVEKWYA